MAVSVRMDPLLEKQLDAAAKRRGITKSQFIIEAVERALGRKDPYALMMKLIAEEEAGAYGPVATTPTAEGAAGTREVPYDTEKSKQAITDKLRAKHGLRGTR